MNHPACDVAPDELLAFTEEDVPEQRMQQLEAHVSHCPTCQDRLAQSAWITRMMRDSTPQPDDRARRDLLVRLYQEASEQARPKWDWAPAVSVTAIGGIFLLALVMLWSGLGEFLDGVSAPFQRASPDDAVEWVTDRDDAGETFHQTPMPTELSSDFPLFEWAIRSGIRVLVYQDGPEARMSIEVSQFHVEGNAPPSYMHELDVIDGVRVYADDTGEIHELRWTIDRIAHHLQFKALNDSKQDHLTRDDAREIVRVFLE